MVYLNLVAAILCLSGGLLDLYLTRYALGTFLLMFGALNAYIVGQAREWWA